MISPLRVCFLSTAKRLPAELLMLEGLMMALLLAISMAVAAQSGKDPDGGADRPRRER